MASYLVLFNIASTEEAINLFTEDLRTHLRALDLLVQASVIATRPRVLRIKVRSALSEDVRTVVVRSRLVNSLFVEDDAVKSPTQMSIPEGDQIQVFPGKSDSGK